MKIPFEIGNKLELTHIRSASERKLSEQKFASQVLDFDGIRTVKLSMPMLENRVVPLEVEDDYNLCFFTNSGLYQCKGRVRKRYMDNKISVLDILLLTELKKFQRRKFYRLNCMFTIKYRVISDIEQILHKRLDAGNFNSREEEQRCRLMLDEIPKEWEEATISDLSGGGIRFHCGKEMNKGQLVEVKIPLSLQSGIVPIVFRTEVIACVHYAGSKIAYEIRGEFQNVEERDREIVVKYVFEEQRRRMRKE